MWLGTTMPLNQPRNPKYPIEDEKVKQKIIFIDMVKHLMPKFVLTENVDEKSKQMIIFMDTVKHLLSKFVQMEIVVDLTCFSKDF
ncbi:hypothetical protein Tsubulata_009320 [Turnera subulata]|uniref:Uncharacterized protein n=1 Tax=Turnera subulata TaxID=218843 RepID=A0A9Q0F2A6_9ROSI|nr:hypothetical protein Tsubulata_009320 [Turnera subulata]